MFSSGYSFRIYFALLLLLFLAILHLWFWFILWLKSSLGDVCTFTNSRELFFLGGQKACGILVPRPGIEPSPLAVEAHILNHWTAREIPQRAFYFYCSPWLFNFTVTELWSENLYLLFFLEFAEVLSVTQVLKNIWTLKKKLLLIIWDPVVCVCVCVCVSVCLLILVYGSH